MQVNEASTMHSIFNGGCHEHWQRQHNSGDIGRGIEVSVVPLVAGVSCGILEITVLLSEYTCQIGVA